MIKSLKDLLDKFSRFTNSLVYDGGICKRLSNLKDKIESLKNKTQNSKNEFESDSKNKITYPKDTQKIQEY